MIRIASDDDPKYPRNHELECLEPGEDLRPGAVDARRYEALLKTGRAVEVSEDPEAWPLDTPPREYLDRWPTGPRADLAREILAAEEAPADKAEADDKAEAEDTIGDGEEE